MGKTSLLNERMRKYAYSDAEEIYNDLDTSPNGLRIEQIEMMRERYGDNRVPGKKSDTIWYRLRRTFLNPFTITLFVLAVISLITEVWLAPSTSRNPTTGIMISCMILISGMIRFTQEIRSKKASESLINLVHTIVNVRREGRTVEIPSEKLVVGDYVLLSAGDRIPADIRLTKTLNLFVSQSAITGESAVTEKFDMREDYTKEIAHTNHKNLVFKGTTVISGIGEGIVLGVGKETLYGNFAQKAPAGKSSFEKGANSIAWVLIRFMVVLVPIVFVISGITKGDWLSSFIFSLSVAVGLTPEMLPMVITACLAKGSISMSKKQTIIKDINAMQGFGSMDILCMDKTGTLTNDSILLEYYMDVLGNENDFVLDYAYLNSTYHSGVNNHIDEAILKCHTMPGKEAHYEKLKNQYRKIDEIPFDHTRKCVSVLVSNRSENQQIITKGDVDVIYTRCRFVEYKGEIRPIMQNDKSNVDEIVNEMLEDGMKVMGIARKEVSGKETLLATDEADMILMGYLVFFDAPKKSASQAIAKLKELQVGAKILTGDQTSIALSVCNRVGVDAEKVLTGTAMDKLSDWELQLVAEKTNLFTELTPIQKVRIIRALRENGHTVGFLGDGINDVPAINEAEVGISVDTAMEAAKEVADVILLKKDLNVLEEGIIEGRKTFVNMSKYIKITASSNFGNIFSIVCACVFLPFMPMAAVQLLLLNLLYDIVCITVPWDNVDEEECLHPGEWSGGKLSRFMRYFGGISSVFDIITFALLYFKFCPALCGGMLYTQLTDSAMQERYIALFQTGWFLESLWTQILIIFMLRTKKIPFIQSSPPVGMFITTMTGMAIFTALAFRPIAQSFGLTALPVEYIGFLAIIAICYMFTTTIMKKIYVDKYHKLI